MALNQVGLERLNTATTKKIGTNKNIVINGAMQVAQRNTSATAEGFATVDRFSLHHGGEDEDCTQSQHALTSSDTGPYEEGFRHSYHIQNGNQTSGGDAGDFCYIRQKIEGQNMALSGWDYTSASSNITVSFWIKSSVAFNSLCYAQTFSGTDYSYPFETGTLSPNTWTKITKTIPGNSNLVFDADNNQGFMITWGMYWGSSFTDNSTSLNTWAAYDSTQRLPDMASTWWTTNDATFEVTGVQLEVGSVATDFEHRSYGQELELCRRYFQVLVDDGTSKSFGNGTCYSATNMHLIVQLNPEMRTTPTLDYTTGSNYYDMFRDNSADQFDSFNLEATSHKRAVDLFATGGASGSQGASALLRTNNSNAKIRFTAEL